MKLFTLIGALMLGTSVASAQATIDASKLRYTVGVGENVIPVMIRFNEGVIYSNDTKYHMDYMVWGYRYGETLPPASTILKTLAENDSRLEAVIDGDIIKSIGFDLDASGTIATPKDNYAETSGSETWNFTRSEDLLTFSYGNNTEEVLPYVFYVPDESATGVFMPDVIYMNMSDTHKYIPYMIHRVDKSKSFSAPIFSTYSDAGLEVPDKTILSGVSTQQTYTAGMVVFTGTTTGELYVKGLGRTYSPNTEYVASSKVIVAGPKVPITSIRFPLEEISMGLKQTCSDNKLIIEPSNATFTKINYTSSDTKVATINSTTGNITSTATPGNTTIKAEYPFNPELVASCAVTTSLLKPITGLSITGIPDDATEITLTPKRMIGLRATVEPADADIQDVNVEFIVADGVQTDTNGRPLNAEGKPVMSTYKVNYWDENNSRIQFFELSGHYPGTGLAKVRISSPDGTNSTKEYNENGVEPDRTPLAGGYLDVTIILKEEWFGHTNGGLNYLTADNSIIYQAYERENPFQSFGATSQFGTQWGGKLFVSSKQAIDGGDPLPGGGRLVAIDAQTMKRIGSIDDLVFGDETKSADGRAIAGAGINKIYQGSTNGIYIINTENLSIVGKIATGEDNSNLYEGQVGDMVNAGRYVYAIVQKLGVLVIDTTTDTIVKTIEEAGIQGITQSADGNVWYATTADSQTNFVCLNPTTFEEIKRAVLPATNGTVACSWGAWRSTNLFASKNENVLWFLTGAGGITGGGSSIYKWNTEEPIDNIAPFFQLNGLEGSNSRTGQNFYATQGFDSRSNTLIVMTVDSGSSGHYRYAWTHLVNGNTGEIEKTIPLEPYYWFQSMPIFPDKYPAEFDADMLSDLTLDIADGPKVIDLKEAVSDKDNIDRNIQFSLGEVHGEESPVEVSLDEGKLTIAPKATGTTKVGIVALSNGRLTQEELAVTISDMSGISTEISDKVSVTVKGQNLEIVGAEGMTLTIYNTLGQVVKSLYVDSQICTADTGLSSGVYVVKCGQQSFKVIIK